MWSSTKNFLLVHQILTEVKISQLDPKHKMENLYIRSNTISKLAYPSFPLPMAYDGLSSNIDIYLPWDKNDITQSQYFFP